MTRHSGFSLVELLVVVAIVAILSGIVLTSLNSSRSRANDFITRAALENIIPTAQVYYSSSTPNSYGPAATNCVATSSLFVSPEIGSTLDALLGDKYCAATNDKFIIAVTLPSGLGWWCVDNTGSSTRKSVRPPEGTTGCGY